MIRIVDVAAVDKDRIFTRKDDGADLSAAVSEIIATVRKNGDGALRAYISGDVPVPVRVHVSDA